MKLISVTLREQGLIEVALRLRIESCEENNELDDAYEWEKIRQKVVNPINPAEFLGRLGGSQTSKVKAKTAAENGKKGGRPPGSKNKVAKTPK